MSKRDGSLWPSRWALPLALALWFCSPFVLQAQPSENSGPQPSALLSSIEQRLTAIVAYSKQLESELQRSQSSLGQATQRLGQLQSELAGLRSELETWQTHSGELEKQAAGLESSITELQRKLSALSKSYETTETSWRLALDVAEKDLKRRKLERWLWAGVALVVGAAVGFGIAQAIPCPDTHSEPLLAWR